MSTTEAARNGKGHRVWRRAVTVEKRHALQEQREGRPRPCSYCGHDLDLTIPWPDSHSVVGDHPTSLARGGTNRQRPDLLHSICNARKGAGSEMQSIKLRAAT